MEISFYAMSIFSMDYFLNEVIWSKEDLLIFKVCVKITAIIQEEFNMQDYIIHIFDVGGQRNAWKKWIHQFDSVTAVPFVAVSSILAKYFIQHWWQPCLAVVSLNLC